MEHAERELIEKTVVNNFELRRLYTRHRDFERRLDELKRQPFLTSIEQVEQKKLKNMKLRGVERMMFIISRAQT